MLTQYLNKLRSAQHLTEQEASDTLCMIMDGKVDDLQIEQILAALSDKGEHVDELVGFAKTMREHSVKAILGREHILDTCGTGGDGGKTFNISTAVAFIAAAAGVPVAKHGNKAVSGKTGSVDVLEALGIEIDVDPIFFNEIFKQTNLLFLHAQLHHPAMRYVAPIRKRLQRRTIFNMIGPLTNPAGASHQIIGVYHEELTEKVGTALQRLGCRRGMVVHSQSGLDELSLDGENKITEIFGEKLYSYRLLPEEVGLSRYPLQDIAGGDAGENAEIIRNIFRGATGAKRDIVVLNAGAALYIADKSPSVAEGVKQAERLLDSGEVYRVYESYRRLAKMYCRVKGEAQ